MPEPSRPVGQGDVLPPPDSETLLTHFVATTPTMLEVLAGVHRYARAATPVLLVGATGTGKTTVAELLHAASGRSGPFRAHTAGEFDPQLERSQLFGHERGAFTDAVGRHMGVLEESAEGTLLLDDFHHCRHATQTLLLRVLDRGRFRRLGSSRDLPLRCRVVIGLSDPPDQLVQRGVLLEELRFRLGYSVITLPRLVDRREDIPALAYRFLARCPHDTGQPGPTCLAPEAAFVLQAADWPGNLRQLAMVIREAYLRAHAAITLGVDHLADLLVLSAPFRRWGDGYANADAVHWALTATRGRVKEAAKLLRAARSTVYTYRGARDARVDCRDQRGMRQYGDADAAANT
jgi:DNA-binding NtrC family response regulator